jgi:hypothetical protein
MNVLGCCNGSKGYRSPNGFDTYDPNNALIEPIAIPVGPIIFFTPWQLMDMRLQDIMRKQPVAFDVVCSEQTMEQCNIYPSNLCIICVSLHNCRESEDIILMSRNQLKL